MLHPGRFLILAFASVVLVQPGRADILLVNADGSGEYPNIQAAIDAAVDGDEVVLSAGEFSGEGNREIRYHGKAIVVRGEGAVTIDPDEPELDHHSFIFDGGEGVGSVLESVTVYGYTGLEWGDGHGSLEILGASPTFRDCTFAYSYGTAVYSDGGTPTFIDCWFHDSQATGYGPAALYATAATLTRCRFENNWNDAECGSASIGQAMIDHCTFTGSSTHVLGGALCVGPGSVVEDSSISGWAQYYGDAVAAWGPATFRRCQLGGAYFNEAGTLYVGSGCVLLQDCTLPSEEIYPPDACVRRVGRRVDLSAGGETTSSVDESSWGKVKAGYR